MEAAVISEKGPRATMEDAHYLDLDFGGRGWAYGGIYDGHNGGYAAGYAAEKLHQIFLEKLLNGLKPEQAFIESYEAISEELKAQESGTTAVDFLIQGKRIYTANVGDTRAVMVTRDRVEQLTVDHRLDNSDEKERVVKAGAYISYPYVVRGAQGIMPTRTIGDQYFKAVGVMATPSVNQYSISENDLMFISACDGLWDFMTNEEVAVLVRQYRAPGKLLDVLKHEVLVKRLGTDNLTIIAVSLP